MVPTKGQMRQKGMRAHAQSPDNGVAKNNDLKPQVTNAVDVEANLEEPRADSDGHGN